MSQNGLDKLYWGFLFIMIGFRIQGFDILPDIVGYLLFASGFSDLSSCSDFFNKAAKYNIPMIILSIFSIYQRPAQGGGIQLGPLGAFGILISIASFILNLLVVYNLFMGINEMEERQEQLELAQEATTKWNQYMLLQIATLFSFIMVFIPLLGVIYIIGMLIASIIVATSIMGFIRRCRDSIVLQ